MADSIESDDLDQLEVWCAGEAWCPVTTTATLIGKKWDPVIIHRLLDEGPSGFNELKADPTTCGPPTTAAIRSCEIDQYVLTH